MDCFERVLMLEMNILISRHQRYEFESFKAHPPDCRSNMIAAPIGHVRRVYCAE